MRSRILGSFSPFGLRQVQSLPGISGPIQVGIWNQNARQTILGHYQVQEILCVRHASEIFVLAAEHKCVHSHKMRET